MASITTSPRPGAPATRLAHPLQSETKSTQLKTTESSTSGLGCLPDALVIHVGQFLNFTSLSSGFLVSSKHIHSSLSSYDADRGLWKRLAITLAPNVILSAYSMNLPSGFTSWKKLVTRNMILNKFKWDKAKEAEKAVISEKKESRSSYSFLVDSRRDVLYRVGGHYFFTVHEMHIEDIELESSTSLIVTTKKWKKIRAAGVPPNPLRYYSISSVPWQYSIPEMPCSALFRIGGADASFPYAEYIDIVILMPFVNTSSVTTSADSKVNDSEDGYGKNILAKKVATANAAKHVKWRWVRPKVHGNLPPPRRSHSSTYIEGSRCHRLVIYGGGSSTNGIKNFDDLWVLDTYTDSTYQDYMGLKAAPPPASFKATIDNINVLWTKPKIGTTVPQTCSGRFGHAAMFIPGTKCQELIDTNGNAATDLNPALPDRRDKSFGILVFGGMAFGGSLGMHDIHSLYCTNKDDDGEELHFEWKMHIPNELGTFGPPSDLKGHSITYIGNKLVLLGGDERSKSGVKKNSNQIKRSTDKETKMDTVPSDTKKDRTNEDIVAECKDKCTAEICGKMRVYVLDVLKQQWYLPINVGDYTPSNRSGHGAELWGGQIVLTGGYDNSDKGAIDRNSRLVKTNAERFVVV